MLQLVYNRKPVKCVQPACKKRVLTYLVEFFPILCHLFENACGPLKKLSRHPLEACIPFLFISIHHSTGMQVTWLKMPVALRHKCLRIQIETIALSQKYHKRVRAFTVTVTVTLRAGRNQLSIIQALMANSLFGLIDDVIKQPIKIPSLGRQPALTPPPYLT